MANIYTKIQRKINRGEYEYRYHSLEELRKEKFDAEDAVKVILKPYNFYKYTDDESHARYAFEGLLKSGRMLKVVVYISQDKVQIKTAYEIFKEL